MSYGWIEGKLPGYGQHLMPRRLLSFALCGQGESYPSLSPFRPMPYLSLFGSVAVAIYLGQSQEKEEPMVSRIRRTLTVQQRMAEFEQTSRVAVEATEEERKHREEKTARLRRLRLAATTSGQKR